MVGRMVDMRRKCMDKRAASRLAAAAVALVMVFVMALAMMPQQSLAAVTYLPDVSADMSKPAYWSGKMDDPEKTLVSMARVHKINDAIAAAPGTGTGDLATFSQTEFDSEAATQALYNSAVSDAKYFFGSPNYARYDGYGNGYSTWDAAWEGMYKAMAENCIDVEASGMKPVQYAICTKRTNVLSFPSTEKILDDPADPDFDYQYQTAIRVGEPVIIKARSKDHRFYSAVTTCTSGWIPASDIAICSSRDEWLDAWKFSSDETLVVYDDKVFTEDSNTSPETANVKLPMGTCLKLASESEWSGLITNRSAHNNHVVWLPIRNAEGKYEKKLALVAEHLKVSEGFLPLTHANVAMVALNWLGNCYGWGGMLGSEDCSGYVRDVYKCFGLELARNTTQQGKQPVKKFDLSGLSAQEKAEIIKKMPVGSVLIFPGHEMIYLGCEGDKLYVISSVSKVAVNGSAKRIRNTVINTLDIGRTNGHTWLEDMTIAEIPYRDPSYVIPEKPDPVKPAVPGRPSLKAAVNLNNMTVKLSWKAAKDATGYEVAYRKVGASKWDTAQTVATTYTVKALYVRGKYQFRVRAVNKGAGSPAGGAAASATDGNAAGTKYGAWSAVKNRYMKKTTYSLKKKRTYVRVSWKKDSGASGYQIRYAANKSMKNAKTLTVKGAKKSSLKLKNLKKGKRYFVQVRLYKTVKGVKYTGVYGAAKSVKR